MSFATPNQVRQLLGFATGLPVREWLDDSGAVVDRNRATMLRLTVRLESGIRSLRVDVADLHDLKDVLPGAVA